MNFEVRRSDSEVLKFQMTRKDRGKKGKKETLRWHSGTYYSKRTQHSTHAVMTRIRMVVCVVCVAGVAAAATGSCVM